MPFPRGDLSWRAGLSCTVAFLLTLVIAMAAWPDEAAAGSRAFTAASVLLGAALALLAGIDAVALGLPNVLTLPLVAAGLIVAPLVRHVGFEWYVLGAAAGYLLLAGAAAGYARLRGRQGLGLGDAKLFAAAGAWTGLDGLPSVLLLASAFGLAFAAMAMIVKRDFGATSRIPFGPFLAAGIWIVWLVGPLM